MIVEWLISVGNAIAQWACGLIPHWDPPEWFTGLGDSINGLFSWAQGLGPLVDWGAVAVIAGVPVGLWAAGLLFKVGRLVVSHIPFFGGGK